MTEDFQTPPAPSEITARVKRNARQVLLPAALLILYGFFLAPQQSDPLLTQTVTGIIWASRIGAAMLMVAAVLCRTGAVAGLMVDALTSSGLGAAFAAATGVLASRGFVLYDGVITAVFALVFLRAAWSLWQDYAAFRRADSPPDPPE